LRGEKKNTFTGMGESQLQSAEAATYHII